MAKPRTNTLSDGLLAELRETRRRVLSEGSSPGSAQPFGDSSVGTLWFRADSVATVSGAKVYTGKLYTAPNGAAVGATTVKARNANDLGSGAAVDAPLGVPFFVLGRLKIGSADWFHLFSFGGGGGAKQFTMTGATSATPLGGGTAVTIVPAQGHGNGDLIWAVPADGVAGTWVEVIQLPTGGTKYKVLQVVDTVGRLGLDWVRAH